MSKSILPVFHVSLMKIFPAQMIKTDTRNKVLPEKPMSIPSQTDYTLIAENNIFHPERKIPPEKKAEAPPLPKPDIVLYGTLITDDVSLAYLEDLKAPRSTQGRGKRQLTLKKGDIISGFVLKDIEADKIVMSRGEERITVNVRNIQRSPSKRSQSQSQSPPLSKEEQLRQLVKQPEAVSPTSQLPPKSAFEQSVVDFFQSREH